MEIPLWLKEKTRSLHAQANEYPMLWGRPALAPQASTCLEVLQLAVWESGVGEENSHSSFFQLSWVWLKFVSSVQLKAPSKNDPWNVKCVISVIPHTSYLFWYLHLKLALLKEASHKNKTPIIWFHLYLMSRINKTIETESRLMLTQGWGRE